MNQTVPKNRLDGVDGIRALACLWVFLTHAVVYSPVLRSLSSSNAVLRVLINGELGVAIFFVLSGYLLAMPFWRAYHSNLKMPDLKIYFLRRIARIAPEFYVCVILTALLGNAVSGKWDLIQIGSLLTFTSPFLPAMYAPSFNIALWSIGIEMQFYFLLPLVMYAVFRCLSVSKVRTGLILTMVAIAGFQLIFLAVAPIIDTLVNNECLFASYALSTKKNTLIMFAHFLFGVLAADMHVHYGHKITKHWRYDGIAITCLSMLIIPVAIESKLPQCDWMFYQWPLFPAAVGCLLFVLPGSKLVGKILNGVFFRKTAVLSFGIYLYHIALMAYATKHLPELFNGKMTTYLLTMACILILSYITAFISYMFIGKPALTLSRKIEQKWLTPKTHTDAILIPTSDSTSQSKQAA